jgi:ATP-dependent helicase HrpB
MLQPLSHLPAFALVSPLQQAIDEHNVIIGAPPGAGKSTVLPLALLQTEFEGKVLLMQPRRVVVRNLADYLAKQLGEPVGKTVGYRIKGESKVSSDTKLEIITEGILSRMIQQDPELDGVSVIVFDEFHERSIHSDFGLALALEVQAGLREDLRLVIMSATLDVDPLTALLQDHSACDVQTLFTEGRTFPVDVRYSKDGGASDVVPRTIDMVKHTLLTHSGDVVVFLPGRGSINAVARGLSSVIEREDVALHRLYGALSKELQQAAIAPDPDGRRKVILSTNIAETSLTIEGVRVVIDSLWENRAHYHAASDITALAWQRISQASAIQRMGRAGRVSEGVCYRLCSKDSYERLAKFSEAQIEKEDVSSLLLDTYAWGSTPNTMALLTKPSAAQTAAAQSKLSRINAVEQDNLITAYGRKLAQLPCQPHLAHLLLLCRDGVEGLDEKTNHLLKHAAPFVVALSENSSGLPQQGDVLTALKEASANVRHQLIKQAKRYAKYVGLDVSQLDINALEGDALGLCIAIAFPLQVGYSRLASAKTSEVAEKREYKLASGKGANWQSASAASQYTVNSNTFNAQWIAVLEGQLLGSTVTINLAQAVPENWLRTVFDNVFRERRNVSLNAQTGQMEARVSQGFYAITLNSRPVSGQEKAKDKAFWQNALVDAWIAYLDNLTIDKWPLGEDDWQWWYRVMLASKLDLYQASAFDGNEPWPSSLNALLNSAREGMHEALGQCHSLKALESLPWKTTLNNGLTWPQQDALAKLLPTTITLPTNRTAPLKYQKGGDVVLSVKMTEMYSQNQPITLANGKVTVVCELLSPAGRPLQTTSDLGAFWQGSYKEIQKEMKGRYPKHFWPDDPANASPTHKTKKHM